MSKSKTKNSTPPKSANTVTKQLRWYLKNCGTTPVEVSRQTGIHHAMLYRFLLDTRSMSLDTLDRLAKHLKLRLVRDDR